MQKIASDADILIVDDDPGMLDLLSSHLRQRSYRVTTAGSAGEAVTLARSAAFTVIICDLKMPILDGLSCLELIKSFRPETEFIMISGEGTIRSAADAIKKGAVDFLQKPIQMEVLLKLIEKTTARHRLKSSAIPLETDAHKPDLVESLKDLVLGFEANSGAFWRASGESLSFEGSVGYGDAGPSREMLDLVVQVAAAAKSLAPRNGALNQIQRDGQRDGACESVHTQIRSHLAVPLFFENRFFGVLGLTRLSEEAAFTPHEAQAVREVADRMAARIAYSALRSELDAKTNELKSLRENKKAA